MLLTFKGAKVRWSTYHQENFHQIPEHPASYYPI